LTELRVVDRPEVLTDLAAVERILPEWRALADRAARSPLEAPDWLLPLAQLYHARDAVRFFTWRVDGDLVGVAPYNLIATRPPIRPLRDLAPWGTLGPRMRGMVDVVALDEHRGAVLESLAEWLRDSTSWDLLRVVRPQFGSTTPARIRSAAKEHGWAYAPYENIRSTTYQVDLPATTEEWDGLRAGKTRRTMRWQTRKFAELRDGTIEAVADVATFPQALDATQRLLAARWGSREVYFHTDPLFRRLLDEALPEMAARGAAWLSVARDRDGLEAVLVSLAQNGYAMSLLVAANGTTDFRPFSLGNHVFDEGIREAVRRGCHTYDFLWAGGYKEDYWHAQARKLEAAVVGRGLIGRFAAPRVAARITAG
jgi:CelD/BcsL family acetyltransferase involved in cellulose biosynthesis